MYLGTIWRDTTTGELIECIGNRNKVVNLRYMGRGMTMSVSEKYFEQFWDMELIEPYQRLAEPPLEGMTGERLCCLVASMRRLP